MKGADFHHLPEQVVLTVVEADAVIKGQTASSSYKPAVVDNGERIMVPPHIEVGTRIVVRTEDKTYLNGQRINQLWPARSALINVMHKASVAASRRMMRDFGEVENLQVTRKGAADFVSQADITAERTIQEELKKPARIGALSWKKAVNKSIRSRQRLAGLSTRLMAPQTFCMAFPISRFQ